MFVCLRRKFASILFRLWESGFISSDLTSFLLIDDGSYLFHLANKEAPICFVYLDLFGSEKISHRVILC